MTNNETYSAGKRAREAKNRDDYASMSFMTHEAGLDAVADAAVEAERQRISKYIRDTIEGHEQVIPIGPIGQAMKDMVLNEFKAMLEHAIWPKEEEEEGDGTDQG